MKSNWILPKNNLLNSLVPNQFLILLLLTQFGFGQESRNEMVESKIYVRATYFEQKNKIIGLQVRTDLQDTIIENQQFHKFKTEDFINDVEKRMYCNMVYDDITDVEYTFLVTDSGTDMKYILNYLIKFFETVEQYEKCAELMKLLNK